MMLQNLRDNLKGAVAIVVIVIFVVPLVLFGVEQLFVGSVGGTDVASVNGEGISRIELQRELAQEKGRLQQQMNLEANNPRLDDSVLTGPVLDRMVKRAALIQAARDGGMGASKDALWAQVRDIEAFHIDGKFDSGLFKERISYRYTPATFLDAIGKDYVLNHLNSGIVNSSFVTDSELSLLAAITQQKRSFFAIEVPQVAADKIAVTEAELRSFYEENNADYIEPESVVVEYVELSLAQLAATVTVSDAEIRQVYDAEVEEFDADPKYQVAHILVESKDDAETKVSEISSKLANGEIFEDLAKAYSDDLGSKSQGGALGVMIDEAYPKEFVAAAKTLTVGAVSDPVKTSAGTHFIKLLGINNAEPPSFDERKVAIKDQLARQMAQEDFVLKSTLLDEKTFGSDSLQPAAEALGVQVKTSASFTRRGGAGISANKEVIDAAFADDVLKQSHNSRVINLEGDRAVVVRLKKHQPELLKPFETVKNEVQKKLVEQKQNEILQQKVSGLLAKINAGVDYQELAEQENLEAKLYEEADRTSFDGNPSVLQKAFSLARPQAEGDIVADSATLPGKGMAVIGLLAVKNGDLSSMEETQKESTKRQLVFQINRVEMDAFEKAIIETADIDKPE